MPRRSTSRSVLSMPTSLRSKAWLFDNASKLKPSVPSASSASAGARNPRPPPVTDCPGSAIAPSKFVKTTSPRSSGRILGTASGAVARRSERIIDWPVNVIVTPSAYAGPHASNTQPIHARNDSLIGRSPRYPRRLTLQERRADRYCAASAPPRPSFTFRSLLLCHWVYSWVEAVLRRFQTTPLFSLSPTRGVIHFFHQPGDCNVSTQHDPFETRHGQRDRGFSPATRQPRIRELSAPTFTIESARDARRYHRRARATCSRELAEPQLADFHRGLAEAARHG